MDGFAALGEVALGELPAGMSEAAFATPVVLEAGPGGRAMILLVELDAWDKAGTA